MKAFIVNLDQKPIFVGKVVDIETTDFVSWRDEAEENLRKLVQSAQKALDRIEALEEETKALRAEIAYLKGE